MKKNLFYFVLTLFFIGLLLYLVDVNKVISILVNINPLWVIIAVSLTILQSILSSFRLKTLLSNFGNISVLKLMQYMYIGMLTSLIIHFSGGGLTIVFLVKNKMNISYKKTFAALLLDFFLSQVAIISLAGIGLFYFADMKKLNLNNIHASLFQYLAIFLVIFSFLFALIFLIYKHRLYGKVNSVIESLLFFISKSGNTILAACVITIPILLLSYLSFYAYFRAFSITLPVIPYILASSMFAALGLIPGVPAKIGQYEIFALLTLPYLLNVSSDKILAVALVSHAVGIALNLAFGWIALYKLDSESLKLVGLEKN